MSNMSYCRWQNTLRDLQDCVANLRLDPKDKSVNGLEERDARQSMIELMVELLHDIALGGEDDPPRPEAVEAALADYDSEYDEDQPDEDNG
jgi:hypothetical protein